MSNDDALHSKIERRVATVEEAIKLLTELALRADDQMDTLEAAQTNSESKLAALTDAQIRTETTVAKLSTAMEQLAVKMSELATAQVHTDQRLDVLIGIIRDRPGEQPHG